MGCQFGHGRSSAIAGLVSVDLEQEKTKATVRGILCSNRFVDSRCRARGSDRLCKVIDLEAPRLASMLEAACARASNVESAL
jgi:hypothetical protein